MSRLRYTKEGSGRLFRCSGGASTHKSSTPTLFFLAKQTKTSTRHTHTAITRKNNHFSNLSATLSYHIVLHSRSGRDASDGRRQCPRNRVQYAPVGNGHQGQGLRGPQRSIECRLRPSPNRKVDFLDATAEAHAPTSNPMAVRPTPKSGWIQLPKAAHHAMSNLAVTGLEEAAMHRVYSFGSTNVDGYGSGFYICSGKKRSV